MSSLPQSKIGLEGWLAVLVVASISMIKFSPGIQNSLWYKYRTVTGLWEHAPYFIGFLWRCASVLMAVSWYYTLTVTSNNGWINNLFLHLNNNYDVLLALIFVNVVLVKAYEWFFCMMDYCNFRFSAFPDYSKKDMFFDTFNPAPSQESMRRRLEVKSQYTKAVSGKDTTEEFKQKMIKYNFNNEWVRWGQTLYLLAVLTFGAIIVGYLFTKYGYAPADHSYVVILWTWFVALALMLAGFIYHCVTVFSTYNVSGTRLDELTGGIDEKLIEFRDLESVYF